MKKARKVVIAVVGISAAILCGIVVMVKQNETARMRQWGHEIELVSNLSSDWVQAHIDQMVAIGRGHGMNTDQTLEYGKIIFEAGFTDETAMVGYEESLRRAWELGIPVSEAARQISREMHVLGYNQDDLQRRTIQLTAYRNVILTLSQSIADMTGASALQLKVLLGLDGETFERLQVEAPETLTMMLLRWVGEVTEDISPEYRPYAIEALLQEQLGIRDPRAIDQIRDAILEERIEIMETTLVKPTPTPTPTRTPSPTRYAALGWEVIYDPDGVSSIDYPTDRWQLDDRTLAHLEISGCTLDVFAYGGGVPFEWDMREYDVPVRLGKHLFLRRTWAISSTAGPRLVAYNSDDPGSIFSFLLLGSEALDSKPNDFAVCLEDAEAVLATLTIP